MQSLANETAASQTPQINPDHKRELNKHSDMAFAFLRAADGDKHDIEAMLDDFIDLDSRGDGGYIMAAPSVHVSGKRISDYRKSWYSAREANGLATKTLHHAPFQAHRSKRHVRAGVPYKVTMSISGHLTRSVFDRYNVV